MKAHNLIIKATIIGVGNSEFKSDTVYHGFRFRDEAGNTHYIDKLAVSASVNILFNGALQDGEMVELWMCGPDNRRALYGIKTSTDEAYEMPALKGALIIQGVQFALTSLVLMLFLIGFITIFYSFYLWVLAAKYSPYSREEFYRSPRLVDGGATSGPLLKAA